MSCRLGLLAMLLVTPLLHGEEPDELRVGKMVFATRERDDRLSSIELISNQEEDAKRKDIPVGANLAFVGIEGALRQVRTLDEAKGELRRLDEEHRTRIKMVIVSPDGLTSSTLAIDRGEISTTAADPPPKASAVPAPARAAPDN